MGRPGSRQGVDSYGAAAADVEGDMAAEEEFHAQQGFAFGLHYLHYLHYLNGTRLALPKDGGLIRGQANPVASGGNGRSADSHGRS